MASTESQVSIVVNSYNPQGDARVRTMTEFALRCYRAFTVPAHELILVDVTRIWQRYVLNWATDISNLAGDCPLRKVTIRV